MVASVTLRFEETAMAAGPGSCGPGRVDAGVEIDIEAFLKSVESRAFRLAELSLRDADDALDAVQDAMLQLVRHYSQRPASEWAPLFYRILNNRIRDIQRRRRTRNRFFPWWIGGMPEDADGADPIESAPSTAPALPDLFSQGQAMEALAIALQRLPQRQREAFLLRVLQGLDTADTARAMGCSEGSVKTHYFRALAFLRAALEGHEP
jgi:RNA polymerase sigma-70 factor (ECF subfamily)